MRKCNCPLPFKMPSNSTGISRICHTLFVIIRHGSAASGQADERVLLKSNMASLPFKMPSTRELWSFTYSEALRDILINHNLEAVEIIGGKIFSIKISFTAIFLKVRPLRFILCSCKCAIQSWNNERAWLLSFDLTLLHVHYCYGVKEEEENFNYGDK